MTIACLLVSFALGCPPEQRVLALSAPHVTHRMISARYAPGVMHRVAKKRGIPIGACGMAFDGPPLGSLVRVEGERTGVARMCVVVDISQTRDRARHMRARMVELDHSSARAICGLRYWRSRPKECPVLVTIMRRMP